MTAMVGQEARNNAQHIKDLLKRLKLEAHLAVIPPYSPEANLSTLPATVMYKCVMAELEHQLGSNKIDKSARPTTTFPCADSGQLMWSLEFERQTRISAIYVGGALNVTAAEIVLAAGVTLNMDSILQDFGQRYNCPWILRTSMVPVAATIPRAPLRGSKGGDKGKGKSRGKGECGWRGKPIFQFSP